MILVLLICLLIMRGAASLRWLKRDGLLVLSLPAAEAAAHSGDIRAFLDAPVAPAYEELPFEVASIIREEISSFLGGVGSAADCAGKIQSRMSIWLAENH